MSDFLSHNDEIDFDRAASAFPDISVDGAGDIPASSAPNPGTYAWDDFDSKPAQEVKVTGDDEIEKFEDQFPDIGAPQPTYTAPPPVISQPVYTAAPKTFAPRPQQSVYSATPILAQQLDEDEPQVIKDWREKQEEEIRARDEASKVKRQETILKAERAIDAFYEDYTAKRTGNISENKEQEIEYQNALTAALSTGTTWQRICELIELQNSQSKTLARTGPGTTDLTRFKEVLLRLKREGDAAPGAGGY